MEPARDNEARSPASDATMLDTTTEKQVEMPTRIARADSPVENEDKDVGRTVQAYKRRLEAEMGAATTSMGKEEQAHIVTEKALRQAEPMSAVKMPGRAGKSARDPAVAQGRRSGDIMAEIERFTRTEQRRPERSEDTMADIEQFTRTEQRGSARSKVNVPKIIISPPTPPEASTRGGSLSTNDTPVVDSRSSSWLSPPSRSPSRRGSRLAKDQPVVEREQRSWLVKGRNRDPLNLNLDRIKSDYILSAHFVDDINFMLDGLCNEP
jgi:hypothetical protein